MAEYKDYFIYTKFCICKKISEKFQNSFDRIIMNVVAVFFWMKKKANFRLRVCFVIH